MKDQLLQGREELDEWDVETHVRKQVFDGWLASLLGTAMAINSSTEL